MVHSGSRHLGKEITDYYMKQGQKELKSKGIEVPYELTWLEGEPAADYLHDTVIATEYADLNRRIMIKEILKGIKAKEKEVWICLHNYVEVDDDAIILRKGAISAKADERVIIPINARDGVILGRGKGNPDWNRSAPHGAGRVMKREEVKLHHTVPSSVISYINCKCCGV